MIGGHGLTKGATATLAAQMPAAIAALNAEPDAPQLTVPVSYAPHGRPWPMTALVLEGVVVKVGAPTTDVDEFDTEGLAGDATGVLQVAVWAQIPPSGDRDADHADLAERLHRYGAAVFTVLAHPDAVCAGSVVKKATTAVAHADVDPTAPEPDVIAGAVLVVLQVGYVESTTL